MSKLIILSIKMHSIIVVGVVGTFRWMSGSGKEHELWI